MHIFHGIFAYISVSILLAYVSYHNMAIGITLALTFFHLLHYNLQFRKLLMLIGCYAISLGYIHYNFYFEQTTVHEEPFSTVFRFTEYPIFDGNKMEVIAKHQSNRKYLLSYYLDSEADKHHYSQILKPGVLCSMEVTVDVPSVRRNPNAFDYNQYLQAVNIKGVIEVKQIYECKSATPTLLERLLRFRQKNIEKIEAAFPNSIAPVVTALVFGEKEKMDINLIEDYQQLGISHLLAISGLHVGIFSAALYYFLIRIHIPRELATKIMLFILPIYAILTGLSPSVNRAVFMTWCVLFLSTRKIKIEPLDALGISFIIFFTMNPNILYHVGFQLSYLVATSLLLSRSILQSSSGFVRSTITVSFIATLSSLPIILFHFYEFNIFTILINLIFVPLYSALILPLCLITFSFITFIPILSTLLINVLGTLITWSNRLANLLANIDGLRVILGKPPSWILVGYFVSIVFFFILLDTKRTKKRWKYSVILLIPFVLHILFVKYSPVGEVTFLDVGQGDSVFIRLPFNKGNYLIDTGGVVSFQSEAWEERKNPYDPGEKIVVPFLKSKGISSIDKLILTHGDSDHIGGTKAVVEELKVRQLIVGYTLDKKDLEQQLIRDAVQKKIEVVGVYRGLNWEKSNYTFIILAPEKGAISSNDASVVIFSNIAGLSWLFTGDMEEAGESKILETYTSLKVDVLKAGHHGSRTSSSEPFINHIRAKTVIISVGENNRYGHPSNEVIQLFQEREAAIYRTDTQGAITYRFFGKIGYFSTMIH